MLGRTPRVGSIGIVAHRAGIPFGTHIRQDGMVDMNRRASETRDDVLEDEDEAWEPILPSYGVRQRALEANGSGLLRKWTTGGARADLIGHPLVKMATTDRRKAAQDTVRLFRGGGRRPIRWHIRFKACCPVTHVPPGIPKP